MKSKHLGNSTSGAWPLQRCVRIRGRGWLCFRDQDYFKWRAGITSTEDISAKIRHESAVALSFELFPIAEWPELEITEDHVFDAIDGDHRRPCIRRDRVSSRLRLKTWPLGSHSTEAERKECIRELADVFEWLKKTKGLGGVLDGKDDSALFEIANTFAIRHHNPKQKGNYDAAIWYSWMFHFYLATYHASVRLLVKKAANETGSVDRGQ